MQINMNDVIDIQAQKYAIEKANDIKQIAILLAENQALMQEIKRLKEENKNNAE